MLNTNNRCVCVCVCAGRGRRELTISFHLNSHLSHILSSSSSSVIPKSVDDHDSPLHPIFSSPDGRVVSPDVFNHVDNPSKILLLGRPQALKPANFPVVIKCSGGVGGTVACESALRSAGNHLSPRPDGGPKSLRSLCCGLAIYKNPDPQVF
ncbi:hypothetical protein PoB_003244500 [Plakobranchus ocellatus]|uniref:Uncharacterized protein n=1 Tax=Plakobranchus ocellatus TaxID=259542 RepID=A0AAV4AGP9_9GAST|nr:hypothetical protein PoB_003244500 [Plakobranchus ocellatus]